MTSPMVLVVGAGPGVGASVASRFGRAGYHVGLVARSPDKLAELVAALQREKITASWAEADIAEDAALTEAVTRLAEHSGRVDVLHFNPSAFRHKDPLALSADELLADVRLGVASLLTAVQAARPFMTSGGRITATGSIAADRPWHEAASLGVQKAGLRNLVRSIDATLAPHDIRATCLTVKGTLAPDTPFAPDLVADALFAAATMPSEHWRPEVPYDGSPGDDGVPE